MATHVALLLLQLQLLLVVVHAANTYFSQLQAGAIWPMFGRNQYHTGRSPFGQNAASATQGVVAWKIPLCGSSIYSPPVISRDGTVFVSCDVSLYAVDSWSKKVRWSFATGGPIYGAGAVSTRDSLYFGSTDSKLYSVDTNSGTLVWSRTLTESIRGSPVVGADGYIYVGTIDGYVHKLYGDVWTSALRGKVVWSKQPVPGSAKIQSSLGYFGSASEDYLAVLTFVNYPAGQVYGENPVQIKAGDGSLVDNVNLGNFASLALSSPTINPQTNVVYIATASAQSFVEVGFLNTYTATRYSQTHKCCGTSGSGSCGTFGDPLHLCQVMGGAHSSVALNADLKRAYWGSAQTDGQAVGDTLGSDFFYVYDVSSSANGLLTAYPIGAPVQTSAVIDKNNIIYVATGPVGGTGSVVAFEHPSTAPSTAPATLTKKWSLSLPCSVYSSPALHADGTLVFGGSDGNLYAVGNADSTGALIQVAICNTPGQGLNNALDAYDESSSSIGCSACAAGTSSTGTFCAPCSPGVYASSPSSSSCSNCDVGKYTSSFGSTVCSLCVAGTFAGSTGQSVCTQCPAGYANPLSGQSVCSACPRGTSAVAGSTVCSNCPAGTFSPAEGTSACQQCSQGYYSLSGASTPVACPPGTTSSNDFSSCVVCPKGTYNAKSGSSCSACSLGFIHTDDRRSCVECPWPTFTSRSGYPSCDTYTLIPFRADNSSDLLTASISLIAIAATMTFFYLGAIAATETTSHDESQYSGNIVTRLGVALVLLLPSACMFFTTLYVLTKNFSSLATFALMWISLLSPSAGFYRLIQDNHAIPFVSGETGGTFGSRCLKAVKTVFLFVPVILVGYACYLSRALAIRRIWNLWFMCFTGNTYHATRDKFNCRFWNHCAVFALSTQLLPQLILIALNETALAVSETRLAQSWTLIGALCVVVLALNSAIVLFHLVAHRGKLDAAVKLQVDALDIILLHFDPAIIDYQDDAPLEQGMVRGTVIFNGEGIEEVDWIEVLQTKDLNFAWRSNETVVEPSIINLGGFLSPALTFTQDLIFAPEELPRALPIPIGRASRVFEAVPVVNPREQQDQQLQQQQQQLQLMQRSNRSYAAIGNSNL